MNSSGPDTGPKYQLLLLMDYNYKMAKNVLTSAAAAFVLVNNYYIGLAVVLTS